MNTIKTAVIVALSAISFYGYMYLEKQQEHAGLLVPLLTTIICLVLSKSYFKYATILLLIAEIFMKLKMSKRQSLIPLLILLAMPFLLFTVIKTKPKELVVKDIKEKSKPIPSKADLEKIRKINESKSTPKKSVTNTDEDLSSERSALSPEGKAAIKKAQDEQRQILRENERIAIERIKKNFNK